MNNDFLFWLLITGGAIVIHFVVVMAAMLMRAHENKMDALTTVLTRDVGEDTRALELIDEEGVDSSPRLFHIHHHREGQDCEDWMLSVGPGVTPSRPLSVYPSLREPRGNAHYEPVEVGADAPFRLTLSVDTLELFAEVDFPFESVEIVFSGPSSTESFAMNMSTLAFHLAEEYKQLSPSAREGDVLALLNDRLSHAVDLQVAIHEVVLAKDG